MLVGAFGPEFLQSLVPQCRGRRESRMPLHPQPGVRKMKAHQHSHHRFNRISPAFPARVDLTGSFVLSPVSVTS